jgi:hypothetical protein
MALNAMLISNYSLQFVHHQCTQIIRLTLDWNLLRTGARVCQWQISLRLSRLTTPFEMTTVTRVVLYLSSRLDISSIQL